MSLLSAKHTRPLFGLKTPYDGRFGEPFEGPVIPFDSINLVRNYFLEYSWIRIVCVMNLQQENLVRRVRNPCSETQCNGDLYAERW